MLQRGSVIAVIIFYVVERLQRGSVIAVIIFYVVER
jgi:hypothetical protein